MRGRVHKLQMQDRWALSEQEQDPAPLRSPLVETKNKTGQADA
jgi:hypothetical protein